MQDNFVKVYEFYNLIIINDRSVILIYLLYITFTSVI